MNGVEIKEEFLKDLKKISANNGRTITLNFIGGREGAKVIFNDDETMAIDGTTTESSDNTNDRVKFTYSNANGLLGWGIICLQARPTTSITC